jgi:DNA-binding response OmpR family regulator
LSANTDSERTENDAAGRLADRPGEGDERTKRVLLVDDYDLFREALAVVLKKRTSLDEDVQAGSLAEARQVLSSRTSNDFALAVVDLDLPDEDGLELMGELRRAGIPMLALTSRESERLAGESANGVLTTATSCDEILAAARRLVGD